LRTGGGAASVRGADTAGGDSASDTVATGSTLKGRYLLERKIGEGGMGLIFQARDREEERIAREHGRGATKHNLAIKVLQPQFRDYGSAVIEEVIKTRELVHENIVRVGDCQQDGSVLFMTMEFLEGKTLDAWLSQDFAQGAPWSLASRIIEGMGQGLAHAHKHGIVHCDFKPANVFITPSLCPKILDFGIARALRGHPSSFDLPGITPRYASPEMLRAWQKNGMADYRPDARDDIFALAFVVYEILTGRHVLGDDFDDAEQARQNQFSYPTVPELSAQQNAALARAMAFDRAQRPPKAEQFLQEFLPQSEPARVSEKKPPPRMAGTARTVETPRTALQRALARGLWIAAIVTVLTAGLLVWMQYRPVAPRKPGAQPLPDSTRPVAWERAKALAAKLGIESSLPSQGGMLSEQAMRTLVSTSPRRVKLGSTEAEVQAAFALCQTYSRDCTLDLYADEHLREATLAPFDLDLLPVAVQDFRQFVDATGYRTAAELNGAYRYTPRGFTAEKGGTWRNAVTFAQARDQWPVVAVDYDDAQAYCRWKGRRLPSEDEWEYTARGPDRHIFAWGNDIERMPVRNAAEPPLVGSGPMEGIGGSYRNLSGVIWQWTDTDAVANRSGQAVSGKIRKGGSWRDSNLANNWAAMRRYSERSWADDVSGFRCAHSLTEWPDAEYWLSQP
jgi:formylglycine-generating enzyme required for sulfatase activity